MRRLSLAVAGALALAASMQSPAHALFRGDEYEPRDWTIEREYFLDVLSYTASHELGVRYRDARNAYLVSSGSVKSDELYIRQRLKVEADLDGPWGVAFNYEMNQDFDGIYQNFFVGVLAKLGENWRIEGVGEPLAYKEFADEGFALQRRTESSLFRAQFLWPDLWFDDKNDLDARLVEGPFNLQVSGHAQVTPKVELRFATDLDFPLEISYGGPAFGFEFEKYRASLGATWKISDRDTLWFDLSGELAEKERAGHVALDPLDFTCEREALVGRVEYIRAAEAGHRWSFGYQHVRFDESNAFPNNPPESVRMDRIDRIGYFTYSHAFKPDVRFATGVYVDFLDYLKEFPNDPARSEEFDGIESKIALRPEFFGERHCVSLGMTFELDRWAFAGFVVHIFVEF